MLGARDSSRASSSKQQMIAPLEWRAPSYGHERAWRPAVPEDYSAAWGTLFPRIAAYFA